MKKKIFPMLLGALLLPWGSITASAEDISTDSVYVGEWVTPEGEYTYPVTPDDEVWASMNYAEMRDACNMPQELVDMLSTEELVNAALDYPLMLDCLLFDSYEKGIEHLKNTSNVYRELFEREDAAEALLASYADLHVNYDILISGTVKNPMEVSGYDKELVLQLLLASDEIYSSMDEYQVTDLVETLGAKYDEKQGKCDDFATALTFYNVLSENSEVISAELIPESIYEDMAVNATTATGFVRTGTLELMWTGAYYYPGYYEKYGTKCENKDCHEYSSNDFTSIEAAALDSTDIGAHTNWTMKSGATRKYNCHSYCWLDKSYSNIYWLDYPTNYANATSHFTSRGTNVKITYSNSYIILYDSTGPVHSVRSVGVSSGSNLSEWQTSVKVESKLGQRGVFETTLADMMALYGASYYKVYTLK